MTVIMPIHPTTDDIFGLGSYSLPEAGKLLGISAAKLRRWMGGYSYSTSEGSTVAEPLWHPQHPRSNTDPIEIGFADLIELRFVLAFLRKGIPLPVIRQALRHGREVLMTSHPFSQSRFRTDGRSIFLESLSPDHAELLDLRNRQYVIPTIIEQSFKDLDVEADAVVRWRPYKGRPSIVLDPKRSFGQPIAAHSGIPTVTLAEAVRAEGNVERVAKLYDASPTEVRDAWAFQDGLAKAA